MTRMTRLRLEAT